MLLKKVIGLILIMCCLCFGAQYKKDTVVKSDTTSACPLYNMKVHESWECVVEYNNQEPVGNRYCGYVKVYRYTKGTKTDKCVYEKYIGTFKFRTKSKKEYIINEYKNKMW